MAHEPKRSAAPVVLYDWANPQQQQFAAITKLLRKRVELNQRFIDYHYHFHMELAKKRRALRQELHETLSRACLADYGFTRWQRTIRWKYDPHPFCTVGSLSIGGRFNVGKNIDPETFPPFSALYIASDKPTADLEALGQAPLGSTLSDADLALANPASVTSFSVSGRLDTVLDLSDRGSLQEFTHLIKDFKLSPALVKEARGLPVAAPRVIKTSKQLQDSLLNPSWRHTAALCEIPANSQIFGQIASAAGIDGILYPSKLTERSCLAIFPCNFVGGTSWLKLDDEPPVNLIGPERIDATNWEACERTIEEIKDSPLRRPMIEAAPPPNSGELVVPSAKESDAG